MDKLSCAILGKDYCKHQLDQSLQTCSGCAQLIIQISEPAEYPGAKYAVDLDPLSKGKSEALKADRFNEGKPK